MSVHPYMNFNGRCEEAIEFYQKTLGAKVQMLMRYKQCPEPNPNMTPELAEKVMHSSLEIGDSIVFATDGHCQSGAKFQSIALSLIVKTDAEAAHAFAGLSEGGKVNLPLNKTFFSSNFGMVDDRFGVGWMVMVQQ